MPNVSELEIFRSYLRESLLLVHRMPGRIKHDEELLGILASLYDDPVMRVWQEVLVPYLTDQREGLRNVWHEHALDPSFELLDRPECLLVLERADRQRERLRQCWPGPTSWLTRVSEVWGVPL
jgi:hypothetical protein